MVPARVVDSLASALRGRRSTLSYAGLIGAGEAASLHKKLHAQTIVAICEDCNWQLQTEDDVPGKLHVRT